MVWPWVNGGPAARRPGREASARWVRLGLCIRATRTTQAHPADSAAGGESFPRPPAVGGESFPRPSGQVGEGIRLLQEPPAGGGESFPRLGYAIGERIPLLQHQQQPGI